ncbi:hypothetical protein [Spirilliplanes yamanashiensis]|uniref:Uncharacterized protein n=1 Tax=Spirilliplanes yamanashiensis TaxID=42233 RepID=A0A8J3Y7I7_9ACTN|nr:hypothetical protein [Spirilliplanes yamanashiensis]MDP9815067.1 hypothetical protein [Spirilliplanes yamanashiensis]GIJ02723.1 hypothetical protein Sya03_20750 [Spirilliplanes yamanashiensis]
MAAPETPYEAVLHAARDVDKLDCALDAEMLGAALLGSVYAVADQDRATAVREFVGRFLSATDRRHTPAASTIREVFAALVPEAPGAGDVRHGDQDPGWVSQLGRVRLTGSWAYGDVYGDQTSYLATFAYDDAEAGGPEHAVVALVDHNIGITKDVFVGPAQGVVERVREMCADDELTWFRDEDPGRLREAVSRHLEVTDDLTELPAESSVATDRALVGARLAVLPAPDPLVPVADQAEPTAAELDTLLRDFLASPEARDAGLDTPDDASLRFCLSLVVDHAASLPDPDPLRFSPAVAEFFLLDWVHRRAVLDMDDAAMLPRVTRAWAAYAARRRDLPPAAAAMTDRTIEAMIPRFVELYTSGEKRSPATAAVAQLIAEGVDPNDTDAINAWLDANRDRLNDD